MSKVLRKEVGISMDSIAQVIGCIREGNTYQEDWEKKYESYVLKDLYRNNFKEAIGKKKVRYNLM